MVKRIVIIIVVIFIIVLIGILANNYLEIYPNKRYINPSSEVLANPYYAMEKWLNNTGFTVRTEEHFDSDQLAETNEKIIIVESNVFGLGNTEQLNYWIRQGGTLIICLNYNDYIHDEKLQNFLSGMNINLLEDFPEEDIQNELLPDFDISIAFLINNRRNTEFLLDSQGTARLAEVTIGKGSLIITGLPIFMYNNNLKKKANAVLSWSLTGERTAGDNNGIVIARESNLGLTPKTLFGAIMQRGNLVPIGISVLILIIVGFWMVIPAFGLVSIDKQKNSRPIKDRFIAEIRFLKKNKALDYYQKIYEREQKTGEFTEKDKFYNYNKLINLYRRIFNGTEKI
ncbi:MAG: DUF4350 domain-containing protein [Treponema sp.]|nr:DUF4350 domain-containing protein [Treponema sp.]